MLGNGGQPCGIKRHWFEGCRGWGLRSFRVRQNNDLVRVTLGRHIDLESKHIKHTYICKYIYNMLCHLLLAPPPPPLPTLFFLGGGVDWELVTTSCWGVSALVESACRGLLATPESSVMSTSLGKRLEDRKRETDIFVYSALKLNA